MNMKKLLLLTALLFAFPAYAADNTVILTPGSGVTMKSKDVGSGVQAMQPIMSDASGNAIGTSGNPLYTTRPAGADVLYDPGTSNNGLIVSALTIMSTELNSLTNGSVIVSSVAGSSGIISNSSTGQGIWGTVVFTAGTAGATCAAGANIAGWFLTSVDGSTFEPTAAVPARAPDFIVPLPATTLNATYDSQLTRIPALKFKVIAQNNCGASGTLASSGNTLALGIFAVKY